MDHVDPADGGAQLPDPPSPPGIVKFANPLPDFDVPRPDSKGLADVAVDTPRQLPAGVLRIACIGGAVLASVLSGIQIARVLDGEPRSSTLAWGGLLAAILSAAALLAWTWVVVENARRLLELARTTEPPDPIAVVTAWIVPIIVGAGAVLAVAYLETRLNTPVEGTESALPLAIALGAIVVALLVMYRPISMLSSVMRRIGASAGDLGKWVWVPVTLAAVGAFTVGGLRLGGAFGEEFDGIAPAWALAVALIPPVLIVIVLGWSGACAVEETVDLAFARRRGETNVGVGRGHVGLLTKALRADAKPPIPRDVRERIRLIPGTELLRIVLVTSIAALTLVSVVGAIIMFLFWREAGEGVLLPTQRQRAWDALATMQSVERMAALAVLAIASVWSFVNVLNARLATGRRRNPVLAALAWPVAGVLIWTIADRTIVDDSVTTLVTGFALQAIVLYIPFFLLERAALAVGAHRRPLRITYLLGVVLLIHVQGLGGLSTLTEVDDTSTFGRLAGYLALAALLELVSTMSVTEASRLIDGGARKTAERHNFLADQRRQTERVDGGGLPAPTVDMAADPGGQPVKVSGTTPVAPLGADPRPPAPEHAPAGTAVADEPPASPFAPPSAPSPAGSPVTVAASAPPPKPLRGPV